MSGEATQTLEVGAPDGGTKTDPPRLALAIVWSTEPERLGEVLLVPEGASTFGRGDAQDEDERRLRPIRQRPGENERCAPFESPFLSRNQLQVTSDGRKLRIVNQGKGTLLDRAGGVASSITVTPDECVVIRDQLVFLCLERPMRLPRRRSASAEQVPPFGEADSGGIVGESPAACALRDDIAFLAGRSTHALILGASGTGKELVAQAIHALSARKGRQLVARNASTLPMGLIDAELFGNVANYPAHGMPERPGLLGEANGSTLLLDEIGELPEELQIRLLRVLDAQGEYQRLGDARRRTSDVRVLAATNQPVEALRHDVAARFKLRLTLPTLEARREDIPLIARHLLRAIARADSDIGARFFERWDGRTGEPRISAPLAMRLVVYTYETGVRELEAFLWISVKTSQGKVLDLTREVEDAMRTATGHVASGDVTAEQIRAALERAGGVQERAWRELGLASRYVLKRLIKKYGIRAPDDES
jgi:two-component system response regulator HydG